MFAFNECSYFLTQGVHSGKRCLSTEPAKVAEVEQVSITSLCFPEKWLKLTMVQFPRQGQVYCPHHYVHRVLQI